MINLALATGGFEHLFSKGAINGLELKNRVIMPAMATNFASDSGEISELLVDYYVARALGGTGLIIIENTNIDYPNGKAGAYQLRIDSDEYIEGLRRLVDRIHLTGCKVGLQINHAGGLANVKQVGAERVAPSTFDYPLGLSRELAMEEIKEIAEKFALAALRARKAGFDTIEIHGAHGYLISEFMSPVTNQRTDDFGGPLENRMRFPSLVLNQVRQAVGRDYPIIFRFSAHEFLNGGNGADTAVHIARILEQSGADALHVSAGFTLTPESRDAVVEPASYTEGWKTYLAELVKKQVTIPVIAVGVIRTPEYADWLIKARKTDFVAVGRGLIADPLWCAKARSGKQEEIRKCVSCRECFACRSVHNVPIICTINPKLD